MEDFDEEDFDDRVYQRAALILDPEVTMLVRCIHELDKCAFSRIASGLDRAAGISQTQALSILYIWRHEKHQSVYQYMLEREFGLATPTLTASLKSLVTRGFITRTRDENDRRYFRLNLTEEGRALVPAIVDAFVDADDLVAGCLSKEERETFVELANRVMVATR